MNTASDYSEKFKTCKHLLVGIGNIDRRTMAGVHYCSRCMCVFSSKVIDGVQYSVWINPISYEILDAQNHEPFNIGQGK